MSSTTEEDIGWDDEFTTALMQRGLDEKTAEACVAEAVAHCEESGESLRQAFGDPEEYADSVATSRIPVSKRARTDYDNVTMDEYWGAPLTMPAYYLFLGGILAWIGAGLWIRVTVAGLVGSVLLGVICAVLGGAHSLRAAGHRRAALVTLCVALALSGPTALAFFELPHNGLGRIPTPTLIAVALLLNWVGERLERPHTAERRAIEALRRRATRRGSAASGAPDARETRRWLAHLHGLLRGRHHVRRGEARRLVADARQHLEASGTRPQDEFGDVERYALSLVEEGGAKRPSRQELSLYRRWGLFGIAVLQLAQTPWVDIGWSKWGFLAVAVLTGFGLVRHYRNKSRTRTAGSSPDGQ
ncbi:hypothetical protein G4Z16_15020 [Streptomyces bathyalis]|uniref:Uncharacterized protein n=1 Tax=Streptomyces bathyalis TaxID=2710756 RepID=A0A7T1T6W3_9ACTN|nr:hypothetical protein [Streptomyces bathyalis]QPP07477.1 hypothetical protein G4Z16_15020 [Streptomyces bathyalis]